MNARQFAEAMSELDDRYVAEALSYKRPYTSKASPKKLVLLIAAIVAVLALCGFTAHELGLFDRWFQKPSADPTQTVQSAIEGQADKVYTICVRIEAIDVDESETERVVRMYAGSELAGSRGWTDEYLSEHFVVVSANYSKGGAAWTYTPYAITGPATNGGAAVVIETGYVKVTATAPAGYTVEAPAFVKANSSFTVTVKNASGISADTSITVGKETKSGGTDVKELSFTVSAENGNVTVTATASTVYTITLPDEKTEKGLTISFEGPAKAAKDDTVVVTMKVSSKATDKVALTLGDKTKLTDIAWNTVATSGMTVDSTNTNKLEIAQGSNYIQPASMQFSFKMIAENVTVSAS